MGSVLPLFHDYPRNIAVVPQTDSIVKGGEVFFLDMGESVKIIEQRYYEAPKIVWFIDEDYYKHQ